MWVVNDTEGIDQGIEFPFEEFLSDVLSEAGANEQELMGVGDGNIRLSGQKCGSEFGHGGKRSGLKGKFPTFNC